MPERPLPSDLAAQRPTERALENSEAEFIRHYAEFAARGQLYPQTEGSPLLEFAAGGRVLYLFDRTGPYTAQPGAASVIVHGILDLTATRLLPAQPAGEQLSVLGISAVEGRGQVLKASARTWVVQARVPLVLSGFERLPEAQVGDWVEFRTLPPLHGFLVGDRR